MSSPEDISSSSPSPRLRARRGLRRAPTVSRGLRVALSIRSTRSSVRGALARRDSRAFERRRAFANRFIASIDRSLARSLARSFDPMLASVPARPRSRGERRSLRTARRAASSTTTRCDASADSSSSASAPSSSSIARLAPSPRQNNLVATVAAKTPPAPPPPPSGFAAFARANWPVFVLFETVALIGAAVSGVSSRRKRLEIQDLNVKLREMMTKVEQSKACEFNWPSEPSADDDDDDDATPGSALLTKASNLLELGELDAAIATFDEAKLAISGAFGANTSTTKMDDKGAHSSHWSPYDRVGVVNADP
jgi:hypothetical protein